MLNYNGTLCETIEQLEALISDLSDEQKQFLRNDFNGVQNTQKTALEPVSPRQIRLALVSLGISLDQIHAALNSLPQPDRDFANIEWEYASIFLRDNPLVARVAQGLGWTEEQLDGLWQLAATI